MKNANRRRTDGDGDRDCGMERDRERSRASRVTTEKVRRMFVLLPKKLELTVNELTMQQQLQQQQQALHSEAGEEVERRGRAACRSVE